MDTFATLQRARLANVSAAEMWDVTLFEMTRRDGEAERQAGQVGDDPPLIRERDADQRECEPDEDGRHRVNY